MRLTSRYEIEALLRAEPSRCAQPPTECGVAEQPLERDRKRLRIPGRDEEPGLFLDDKLRHSPDIRGHDRQARRHRFEDRERKAFGAAGKDEDVGSGQELGDVVPLACQLDDGLQVEATGFALQREPVGPVAHDHRLTRASWELGERSNERQGVLGRLKTPDRHEPAPFRASPRAVGPARSTPL